jgi:signal transduction histidine kinase/ActR/RegA family two-component response regulator
MRRQDEEQADRKTEEALVADTVGAQIPRSSASATDASPALGIRPRLTLTVAAILAFVAIGAVCALTWHASGARENDERLDDVIVNVNELQGTPWRLQTSQINGQSLPVAQLRARMTTAEQAVLRQLDALNHGSQIPEITRARALLQINFAALAAMVSAVASGNPTGAGIAGSAVFRTHDAVLAALGHARIRFSNVASGTLWQATIGSIVVMLMLLGGFVVFFWRSVKARTSAEALANELELSRQHLEHAQSVVGVGSWEWDDQDRILRWSPEQSRLHGWTGPNPPRTPRDFLRLIAPDDRRRVSTAMRESFVEGNAIDLEYRVAESRGGRLIHIQATNTIEADGRRRVIGTSQDMTERFRRVEAERANRAKNEFISRMSHELRTPLNAVLGFGQLMSMSDLDERQQGNVEHILSAGRHLLDLINEILDISRIESGDMRMSLEPVPLDSVLVDAVDLVRPVASEHDISLDLDDEEDLWVRADVQRLRQVLLNLLSNAVKYNAASGHVWVRTRRESAGGRIRVEVEDDGAGIAPEMIERLFSPFERLGAEQTSVEGTGLGLALSRGMIEAMGGRISVNSVLGKGSTFTIELPEASAPSMNLPPRMIVPPAETEPTEVLAPAEHARLGTIRSGADADPAPRGVTVLCIEDNAANIELVEQSLSERPGVRLLTAADGTMGLRIAREQRVDLVLLDLDLPDGDGAAILSELKGDQTTSAVPVVILSAATAEDQAERLIELGARSYISKPPGVTALLQAVDAVSVSVPAASDGQPSAV